jgi:hypothetical protein
VKEPPRACSASPPPVRVFGVGRRYSCVRKCKALAQPGIMGRLVGKVPTQLRARISSDFKALKVTELWYRIFRKTIPYVVLQPSLEELTGAGILMLEEGGGLFNNVLEEPASRTVHAHGRNSLYEGSSSRATAVTTGNMLMLRFL